MSQPILIIEPFLTMPTLPCLGPATIAAMMKQRGVHCITLYPALSFFCTNRLYNESDYLSLSDNIPLQMMEALFCSDFEGAIRKIHESCDEADVPSYLACLEKYRPKALSFLREFSKKVVELDPRIVCFSLTFGDFNFASLLSQMIKQLNVSVCIVYGGSCLLGGILQAGDTPGA